VTVKSIFLAGLVAALATGCGERDVKLVGERIDIRAATAFENQARPLNLASRPRPHQARLFGQQMSHQAAIMQAMHPVAAFLLQAVWCS